MSKTMNLWVFSFFACILIVQTLTAVIPTKNDKTSTATALIEHPVNKSTNATTLQNITTTLKDANTTENPTTVKVAPTTTRKSMKIVAKPIPKEETNVKKPEIKQDVDLLASPIESKKQKDYGKLEKSSANRSVIHFILIVVLIVGCCCIATTYRKKLMGFFIGFRRTRRSGNVRYRRLSTGEAAIE